MRTEAIFIKKDAYPTALNDEISAIFLISSLLHLRLHRIVANEPYRDDFMRVNGDLEPMGTAQRQRSLVAFDGIGLECLLQIEQRRFDGDGARGAA